MSTPGGKPSSYSASLLPEDYLQRKRDGRSGVIMLGLFCIVMFGIFAAYFVTKRQWSTVNRLQKEINVQYAQEAKKIDQLKVLVVQKGEMLEKADVTISLIEKVPRSILMAELINRMPTDLTLTDFELHSKKIVEAPAEKPAGKTAPRSLAGKPGAKGKNAPKDAKAAAPVEKPKPARYECVMSITGLSRSDQEVADYTAALQQCSLLDKVEFKFSGDVTIDEVGLRKFKIDAVIRTAADAREIEPLHVPRLANKTADAAFKKQQDPAEELLKRAGVKNKSTPGKGKGLAGVNGLKE